MSLSLVLGSGLQSRPAPLITPKQYTPALTRAETILAVVTATTRHGQHSSGDLELLLSRRFERIGFEVVRDRQDAHDVLVKVVCRERNPTQSAGPGPNQSGSTSGERPFAGPPCEIRYGFQGKMMPWQRVDRIVFTLGVEAAQRTAIEANEAGPMGTSVTYLQEYDFPLLLAAEWGQTHRLRRLLNDPSIGLDRKRLIISLLGEIRAEDSVPRLAGALHDESLVKAAALALGNFGVEVRPPLIVLLKTSPRPDVQAAAARSLGNIGATTGDWSLATLFIEVLERPDLDIAVQIELVWALGKNPDRRALPLLDRLYDRAWSVKSDDPQLAELRNAIDWSHRGVRLGGHTDEY